MERPTSQIDTPPVYIFSAGENPPPQQVPTTINPNFISRPPFNSTSIRPRTPLMPTTIRPTSPFSINTVPYRPQYLLTSLPRVVTNPRDFLLHPSQFRSPVAPLPPRVMTPRDTRRTGLRRSFTEGSLSVIPPPWGQASGANQSASAPTSPYMVTPHWQVGESSRNQSVSEPPSPFLLPPNPIPASGGQTLTNEVWDEFVAQILSTDDVSDINFDNIDPNVFNIVGTGQQSQSENLSESTLAHRRNLSGDSFLNLIDFDDDDSTRVSSEPAAETASSVKSVDEGRLTLLKEKFGDEFNDADMASIAGNSNLTEIALRDPRHAKRYENVYVYAHNLI